MFLEALEAWYPPCFTNINGKFGSRVRVGTLDRFGIRFGVPVGSLLEAFWATLGVFAPPWAALGEFGASILGEIGDLGPGWVQGWSQGTRKVRFDIVLGCHLGGFGVRVVYLLGLVDEHLPQVFLRYSCEIFQVLLLILLGHSRDILQVFLRYA